MKIGHVVKHPGKRPEDPPVTVGVPEELETVPGIPSNQREVDWYSREYPLESLLITERASLNWANELRDQDPLMREIIKEHNDLNRPLVLASLSSGDLEPTGKPSGEDVTDLLKTKARELGFCEVGITAYDHRYTYQCKKDWVKYEHAVCLAYEQEYVTTQSIPSVSSEVCHAACYRLAQDAGLKVIEYIRSLGYHGQLHSPVENTGPYIPMFVAAGLGQLGACGYLLSPHTGNRMRLVIVTTDAKITYDQPVDFGIHAFCQVCQVCVNRCPGRALMRDKVWWRGIEKNKVYFKRCRPVMARYEGCAVCMKVCPIQKYGMAVVMQHYAETGQVLGKGTHDLEGYTLADKGYFGPGEMPVFDANFFDMPHGGHEDWAFEKLKHQVAEAGNKITEDMFEQFKKELTRAVMGEKDYMKALATYDTGGSDTI